MNRTFHTIPFDIYFDGILLLEQIQKKIHYTACNLAKFSLSGCLYECAYVLDGKQAKYALKLLNSPLVPLCQETA